MDVVENWPELLHLFLSSELKQIKQQKLMGIKVLDMENSVYSRRNLESEGMTGVDRELEKHP